MRRIPLTQGLFAIIDDEDYEHLAKYKWYAAWSQNARKFYAARSEHQPGKSPRSIRMHRVIVGADRGEKVDHRNGNGLDNRRVNLRRCNEAQNGANRTNIPAHNTSGYCGVSWNKDMRKWRAYIGVNGTTKHVGYFTSKEEAALARNEAAVHYFGEFASINQIEAV